MIIITYIVLLLIAALTLTGYSLWAYQSTKQREKEVLLSYAHQVLTQEMDMKEKEEQYRREEEEKQKKRSFPLDFMITHGDAFGGCSRICDNGQNRKGSVPLEEILLYARHPSGKEYTYSLENEGIRICASDIPDQLTVVSDGKPFVIRQPGMGRGEGELVKRATIRKDMVYYLILESKHEISICASLDS